MRSELTYVVFKSVNAVKFHACRQEVELEGLDVPEFGMVAYPEDRVEMIGPERKWRERRIAPRIPTGGRRAARRAARRPLYFAAPHGGAAFPSTICGARPTRAA